jgi:Spy/CpxP family protein refolding chaperone
MFGFIIGTLCLIALFGTLRRRRYAHFMFAHGHPFGWAGMHGDYGYAAYGPPPRWGGRGYGHGYGHHRGGGRHIGRALLEHLDTTPGQEKAIQQAVSVVREHLSGTHDELKAARKDLAAALGGDVLDPAALGAALGRGEVAAQSVARELATALASVHAALDGEQRKRLAELIADGPSWRGFGRGHC